MKTVFQMTSKKQQRSSCNFGCHFFKSKHVGRNFRPIFREFVPDFAKVFTDFAQIFKNFARIFTKSKLLGVRLHPCLLHHCSQPLPVEADVQIDVVNSVLTFVSSAFAIKDFLRTRCPTFPLQVGWTRYGTNVRYYRNNLCSRDGRNFYSLTWQCEFPHKDDTCYFAHCYPYTYTDLQVRTNNPRCCDAPTPCFCAAVRTQK